MQPILRHATLALLLAGAATSALAHYSTPATTTSNKVSVDGMTFTTTVSGNTMTLEIDASKHTGGVSAAKYLDALSFTNIGTFSKATLVSSPFSWVQDFKAGTAGANGCQSGAKGASSSLCLGGVLPTTLKDNMTFKFAFEGAVDLKAPQVQLNLLDSFFQSTGSLYQVNFGTKTGGLINTGGNTTTPQPTPTPTPTPVPTPTPTPVPTPVPTPTPTPEPTPVPTPTPEPTPTPTPEPAPQPPVFEPTPIPTPTPEPTPIPMPEPAPEPTPVNPPVTTPDPELIPLPDTGPVKPIETLPVGAETPGNGAPSEVPEPETLALMAAGLGLVAYMRRRSNKAGNASK